MLAFMGWRYCTRTCPQKENTFWLTVSWNPFTKDRVMIITVTLMIVATVDNRMINRENDFCWLKAMRVAMNEDRFTELI